MRSFGFNRSGFVDCARNKIERKCGKWCAKFGRRVREREESRLVKTDKSRDRGVEFMGSLRRSQRYAGCRRVEDRCLHELEVALELLRMGLLLVRLP